MIGIPRDLPQLRPALYSEREAANAYPCIATPTACGPSPELYVRVSGVVIYASPDRRFDRSSLR